MTEDVQGQQNDSPSPSRRRLITTLAVGAAVLAIAVPTALAGNHSAAEPAAATPTATPFDELHPPSVPASEPAASPVPTILLGEKGIPNEDGCPVDAPRLLTALRDSDLYQELATPGELAEIDCYATYASARTEADATDRATVIFRYTEMTDSWHAVSGGRTAACEDVPKAIRAHLRRCP